MFSFNKFQENVCVCVRVSEETTGEGLKEIFVILYYQ